jgi:hypothetical protein
VGETSGPRHRGVLFQNRIRPWRVVGTGAGDQHMVDRGRQFAEELCEALEVGGIEGCGVGRGELARWGCTLGQVGFRVVQLIN